MKRKLFTEENIIWILNEAEQTGTIREMPAVIQACQRERNCAFSAATSSSFAEAAHFADRDQSFRSIVITCFGDRDRSGATLDLG